MKATLRAGPPAWLQALPFGAVFLFFFIAPLLLIAAVSFWPTSDYELIPGFTGQNYVSIFDGCSNLAEPCVTLKTYLSTLRFSLLTWGVSLLLGFTVAYFLAFHVRSASMQTVLFVVARKCRGRQRRRRAARTGAARARSCRTASMALASSVPKKEPPVRSGGSILTDYIRSMIERRARRFDRSWRSGTGCEKCVHAVSTCSHGSE